MLANGGYTACEFGFGYGYVSSLRFDFGLICVCWLWFGKLCFCSLCWCFWGECGCFDAYCSSQFRCPVALLFVVFGVLLGWFRVVLVICDSCLRVFVDGVYWLF